MNSATKNSGLNLAIVKTSFCSASNFNVDVYKYNENNPCELMVMITDRFVENF